MRSLSVYKICFLCITALVLGKQGAAQFSDSLPADLSFIRAENIRSESPNPAALQFIDVDKISDAYVSLLGTNGGFKNYFQSDRAMNIRMGTSSFYRWRQGVVFSGSVNYENFSGKNMQGSYRADPYQHPLNFVEQSDTSAGTKKRESYTLSGNLSTKISKKLMLGAGIVYTAGDYAKLKDLRHTNRFLNADLSVGIMYQTAPNLLLGAAYSYRRRIERLLLERHGNTDQRYLVLVDFGNFYGRNELFGEEGYTYGGRPLVGNTNEASLQAIVTLSSHTDWLHTFSAARQTGYFGKKGQTSVIFTAHTAGSFAYTSALHFRKNRNRHIVNLRASYEKLKNFENIYREETAAGGNSRIVYYGKNEVFDQQQMNFSLLYRAFLNVRQRHPGWIIEAGAAYVSRQQRTTLFPFYRTQEIDYYSVSASALKNFARLKYVISFSLGANYGGGSGLPAVDGIYTAPSEAQRPPDSRERYLNEAFEFLTRPRISASPSVQFTLRKNKNILPYIKLAGHFTRAFGVSYLKPAATEMQMTIGGIF